MMNRKLAALLVSAVTLGQAGLMSFSAQTDAETTASHSQEPLQVASVIGRSDLTIESEGPQNNNQPETPDIYTIGNGTGSLPTVIQVLPQDDAATSLFVNGTEVLRFNGEAAKMSSYTRVKIIADRLNTLLENDAQAVSKLRPGLDNGIAVIQTEDTTIATVDRLTASDNNEEPLKLSLLYTNRLRQSLGGKSLDEQVLSSISQPEPSYRGTGKVQTGMASWYGPYFHGRRAADGSRFNQYAMTAAHKTLPFGTLVRVVNQRTKKACLVKITDRGPYAHGRVIDLSRGAAGAIGMLGSGVAPVSIEVVKKGS